MSWFKNLAPSTVALLAALVVVTAAYGAADPTPEELRSPPADAERTPSGLASKLLVAGTGEQPPDGNDLISVDYIGWSPDGREFTNTYAQGKPQAMALDRVFPGWREGIQLMVVGERRRLWIPAHLAPSNPTQGPPGAVVFDVELHGIGRVPNPPEHLSQPPPDAVPNGYGAYSKIVREGTGKETPADEKDPTVLVAWTGWDTTGRTFDTTMKRNRPTLFLLDRGVLPAFGETLRQMVVGEKRHVWIPGGVVAGQWPGAPPGTLIFEVEVIAIGAAGGENPEGTRIEVQPSQS